MLEFNVKPSPRMWTSKTIMPLLSLGVLAANAIAGPTNKFPRRAANPEPRPAELNEVVNLKKRNIYPYPSYQDFIAIAGDVAPDKANFYSGLGYYPSTTGYDMFKAYIAANSFLEVDNIYPANYCVSNPTGPYSACIDFAYSFSRVYAMKASGTAYLLTPGQCDPSPNTIRYVIFSKSSDSTLMCYLKQEIFSGL
ncbi:hypothetical protein OEA41_004015 [Lepraria neglecta]|uniref:Uncharacterized protein n=1 Tax=Lepraria neglecta TaxID=209136 RepID=A0AAD9Z5R1_9LECA|nr:hypothetical protein OEA41_004015 [Lepraria neglecta]